MAKTSHKPGPLKQQNKGHKTGRHRSKGKIDVELKGKLLELLCVVILFAK